MASATTITTQPRQQDDTVQLSQHHEKEESAQQQQLPQEEKQIAELTIKYEGAGNEERKNLMQVNLNEEVGEIPGKIPQTPAGK